MKKNQEVDLNLRHYVGDRFDVIKDVKLRISEHLRNPEVPNVSRTIYSAIYNALTYYQNISDLSISAESVDKTFLENTITEFNKDFQYLSEKYNSKDPTEPRVIQAKGRIKSPISAMSKILSKINEYIRDGMDLSDLNDSLRDFIGLRIIIDVPHEIKAQGKKAEADFCYKVFDDLLTYRGIHRQTDNQEPLDEDYHFIPVNTSHDPNKLEKLKAGPSNRGFLYNPDELGIYIPTTRPENIDKYDEYVKDYKMYPKTRLYQRLHTCAHPYFSKFIPEQQIPNYILPSKANKPSIEYQVCTLDEEDFAEHGKAAHTGYKGERKFHRLGIPLFMKFDDNTEKIRLTRLDEAIQEFYGYTFESMFNIDYQTFLRTFDANQRDEILAGNLEIHFDEQTQEYLLKPAEFPVAIDKKEHINNIQNLFKNKSDEQLKKFYEKNGILDGTIKPIAKAAVPQYSRKIQPYTFTKILKKIIDSRTSPNSTNNSGAFGDDFEDVEK